jgi:calreticulin
VSFYFNSNQKAGWNSRWVNSKKDGLGVFTEAENGGIKTSQDAKFYATSTKFQKPFVTEGKDTVLQFNVNFKQDIGLKLFF